MKTIKMETNDLLVIDPCYIKRVKEPIAYRNGEGYDYKDRFDGLKCVRTLLEGDDGDYEIYHCRGKDIDYLGTIGVDSGRIWVLKAEFNIEVDIDSGMSGEVHIHDEQGQIDPVRLEAELAPYD